MNGDFDIGVRVPRNEDRTIEKFPQTVHDVVSIMADDALGVDRLRAKTTHENWPRLGTLTLSRQSGDTVKVQIEWDPSHLKH